MLGSLSKAVLQAPVVPALTFAAGLAAGASFGLGHAGQTAHAPVAGAGSVATPVSASSSYPAEVLRVIDGDTFEARVRIWPGLEVTTSVRLRDIDAPEMRARCASAREQAQAARTALAALLDAGGVGLRAVGLDKYGGRVLASVSTAAHADVGMALLSAGHARSYHGGRREPWCPPDRLHAG